MNLLNSPSSAFKSWSTLPKSKRNPINTTMIHDNLKSHPIETHIPAMARRVHTVL